ncbi:MAG: HEPN domain-containing protein [Armatimonadetes bacterium]|nr:HEPN domain-containing protein [Armatimonadota bacterium]MCX7967559.1 HEPN domain-containing protein [Armatimonadota bacterium]MDW8143220.1 HEPN domain-containing protein [Armatimonadota bacterium]
MFDESEFERWFRQAEQTLRAAEHDIAGGFWNWACFKAEQAAQFAVKGLLKALGEPAFGHSLTRLVGDLEEVGVAIPADVLAASRLLEREYIPTRYADTYPSGSPYEFYDRERAEGALSACRTIMDFVREVADRARSSGSQEETTTGAD